jgi:hypothetical protein
MQFSCLIYNIAILCCQCSWSNSLEYVHYTGNTHDNIVIRDKLEETETRKVEHLFSASRRRTDESDTAAPTLTPSVSLIPVTSAPTRAPNWNLPTPQPQHTFGTLRPTFIAAEPSLQPTTVANKANTKQGNKSSEENNDILIAVSIVGGVIIIACIAILIYWHVFTRVVSPPSYSQTNEQGISFTNFFK